MTAETDTPGRTDGLGRAFWLLWLGWVVNRVGLLHPAFFALYLITTGIGDTSLAAVAVALQGAGSAAASLVGGQFGDRLGPRRAISLSQVGYAVVLAVMLVGTVSWLVVGLAFAAGFLAAVNRPTGTALVVSLVPKERQSRAFSLLYWANNVGASVGPVLSGLLLVVAPRAVFVLGICTAGAYWFICRYLPPDPVVAADPAESGGTRVVRRAVGDMMRPFLSRAVAPFLALSFLVNMVYTQRQSTLPIDMKLHGVNEAGIGTIFAVNAVLVIVLQPLAAVISDRVGTLWLMTGGSVLVAIGFGANGWATGAGGFIAALCVWTLGEIAMAPAPASFIAGHAPPGRQAAFQGSYYFILFGAMVIGAPLGVFGLEQWGPGPTWVAVAALGLIGAAGFVVHSRWTKYH